MNTENTPPHPPHPPTSGTGATVLVVEDYGSMRELLRHVLDSSGYTVLTAHSTASAMTAWRESPRAISLLIADLELGGGSGLDLSRELVARRPTQRTLLISGHGSGEIQQPPGTAFLRKPFSIETLLRAVRESIPPTYSPGRPPLAVRRGNGPRGQHDTHEWRDTTSWQPRRMHERPTCATYRPPAETASGADGQERCDARRQRRRSARRRGRARCRPARR